nr:zincin-like metallopeptidase domain-containing protein [Brucella intermedia]
MKASIYETITSQIITAIEEGAAEYRMPWHRISQDVACPVNAASARDYRGLNVITLWMLAEAKRYQSGTWATYQQWQEKGAQVRKGEKAASVFFWKNLTQDDEGQAEEEGSCARFVARAYSVFNADQVDGYTPAETPKLSEAERIKQAERFFAAIPATVVHDRPSACYLPKADIIEMVDFSRLTSGKAYYSVLAHEVTHWTGAKTRLDRDLSGRFGTDSYAIEELVAELGAAFIAAKLGLPGDPRKDHAPYIATWLEVLKNDSRAIFTAASKAQAAADYLAAFQAADIERAA